LKAWKVIRNVLLGILGLGVALLIVFQIMMRPSVLTGLVNRFAAEYVDGDLHFRKVRAHVIKSFPFLNLEAEAFSITYPHSRFAAYDSLYRDGSRFNLLQAGRQEEADTLVSLQKLVLSINYMDLLDGTWNIRHAELHHPRIFAHRYDSTAANWDMLPIGRSEKSGSSPLPPIRIRKISLTENPLIVFTDPADTLFGRFSMRRLSLDGDIRTWEPDEIRTALEADSIGISGRLPADTLALRLNRLRAGVDKRHFTLEADANAAFRTSRYGRIRIPVSIDSEGEIPFRDDGALEVDLERLNLQLSALQMRSQGLVIKHPDNWEMCLDALMDDAPLGALIDQFRDNFPVLKKWKTDAVLNLVAHAEGFWGNGETPAILASIQIPESALDYEGLGRSGRIALDAAVGTDDLQKVDADIRELVFGIIGAEINAAGKARDILGDDPEIALKAKVRARLDSLTNAFTREQGISGTGFVDARLQGKVRLSQLDMARIGNADINCSLKGDHLSVDAPPYDLHAYFRHMTADLSAEGNRRDENLRKGARVLALKALFDTLDVTYKDDIYARGAQVELAMQNAAEILGGSKGLTPLMGRLKVGALDLKDGDGMTVALLDNTENFRIIPATQQQPSPRLSLSSGSGILRVRNGGDSYILDSLHFTVSAARHQAVQPQERRRPGRDSLGRRRTVAPRDDFAGRDISFSLSDALSQYVRDWDFNGNVELSEAILLLPAFPLLTKVTDLKGAVDNSSVDLSHATLQAGGSDMTVKGKLTGLRRALTSRRARPRLKLEATLESEYIDANELMRAYAYYTTYQKSDTSAAISFEAADTVRQKSSLIVLPSNLDLALTLEGTGLKYDSLLVNWLAADVAMRDRTLQITNTVASSNMGDIFFEGFYATRAKDDIKAGFDLNLVDITAEKVITLFPAVDSIMPMLTSFAGDLDCELAATTQIDTNMNLILPSVDGVLRISGKDLSLKESEEFTKIASMLMFRNRDEAVIDNMAVTGMVRDNLLEVFPFVLDVDRYLFAASGIQHLDGAFDYHISVIKSPLLVKFGLNAWGDDFDHIHYGLASAKYRSANVPVYTKQLDTIQYSLIEAIHNVFELGVEKAMAENRSREILRSQADAFLDGSMSGEASEGSLQQMQALYEEVTRRSLSRREALKKEILELEEKAAAHDEQ